jgi:heat shock protein HtpX
MPTGRPERPERIERSERPNDQEYPSRMGKRIFLFIATNLAIVVTLSIVLSLLGVSDGVTVGGLDLRALAIFCLIWGMAGSFISLQMSRWIAKRPAG